MFFNFFNQKFMILLVFFYNIMKYQIISNKLKNFDNKITKTNVFKILIVILLIFIIFTS